MFRKKGRLPEALMIGQYVNAGLIAPYIITGALRHYTKYLTRFGISNRYTTKRSAFYIPRERKRYQDPRALAKYYASNRVDSERLWVAYKSALFVRPCIKPE